MDEKELRGLFSERLHLELGIFKNAMLCQDKEKIYQDSYKIEIYINIYEMLLEETENLSAEKVRHLLSWKYGILDAMFQGWLGLDDRMFDELREYLEGELDELAEVSWMDGRRKKENGAGSYQAA